MKQLSILLSLVFLLCAPLSAAKSATGKKHDSKHAKVGKIVKKADANGNRQIDADEVASLEKSLPAKALAKLDKNSNGKLDPEEIANLNEKLSKHEAKAKKGGKGKKDGKD